MSHETLRARVMISICIAMSAIFLVRLSATRGCHLGKTRDTSELASCKFSHSKQTVGEQIKVAQ